ncbi:tRNA pseudouridine(55) synthase TruB [Streptococcus pneumoniae]|nr:tRNA pseudouridine(55) synthase TruB [Streptococcus pneumoniae]
MNGIINLKKEAGMTSHDAVFKLRKILGTKKIGHGGTLDPDVVGVLPIAVGKATRMVEFMQDEGKIYEGEITLGYSTTTEDASGEVIAETPVLSPLDEKLVDEAIASLTGPITQIPPMYSAVKRFTFRVKCSKGTYIRTLSVDLGEKLGYAAHMSHLTRTSAAGLQLEDALALEEIAEKVEAGQLDFLHPLEIGTGDLVKVFLTPEEATEVRFGRFIELDQTDKELAAFEDDKLLAILEKRGNLYKPRKVFS